MHKLAAVFLVVASAAAAAAPVVDEPNPEVRGWGELARKLDQEARATNNPQKYEQAHQLYAKYLGATHAHEDAMAFYDGELLLQQQRYEEAARMYDRSLVADPRGAHAPEAAYAYVKAIKSAIGPAVAHAGKPICADLKPCPIPADVERLQHAFDRYLGMANTTKERPAMEYRRARIWYDYQHFAEAAPLFDHIFKAYPTDELAAYAVQLEMDSLSLVGRTDQLLQLTDEVRKSALMKDDQIRQLVDLVETRNAKRRP